jgi:5,10-methylenetetrahydromethanopterin reductase
MRPILGLRGQTDISKMIELGNKARASGYWGVSLSEDLENCNTDVFLTIGVLSQKCEGLGLMTSVVNQYSRHPVSLAVAALMASQVSNGKFILGLGSGSPATSLALSIDDRRTLARLEEVVRILRILSSTPEDASFDGEFFKIKNIRSVRAKKHSFPIYIPGIRDRTIRFAVGNGEGIVLSNFSSIEYVKHAMKVISSTPNKKEDFQVACNLTYIPTSDLQEGLKIARPFAQRYLSFPVIGETLLEKSGFDPKIALEVRNGNFDRVSTDIVEAMVVVGDSDKLFDRLAALEKLGVSVPIIGTDPALLDSILSVELKNW